MAKRDKDARREQIEREAEEELRRLTRPPGMGAGGPFGGPAGAGGPPGAGGRIGPLSPIEMMADKVQKREVGREARGERPRPRPAARPPVEMFSGPVGSGLTPGFGPAKQYQVPPAFAEQMGQAPSGYDSPGFVSPEYEDYDEDEEMSVTEMAVMDHAARHGLRPEDSVMQHVDAVTAEEMRDQAMQKFTRRQGRPRVEDGIVTDPFAPMGMRGRPLSETMGGGGSGRLTTRRPGQDRPAVGALARLQERRRQEEEARRRELEENSVEDLDDEDEEDFEGEGTVDDFDDAEDVDAGPFAMPAAGWAPGGDGLDSGTEEPDFEEPDPGEIGTEEPDPEEPDPDETRYGGGAIGRLLAQRARAVPEDLELETHEREEREDWAGGAPGRLHARERMHARGIGETDAGQDPPSAHLEQLMARASEKDPAPPGRKVPAKRRKPAAPTKGRAAAARVVEQPPKRASLKKAAAATTKGATRVATARKAGGGGTTSANETGKPTSAKGGTGRAAEKAALDKTPAAKRARAIKATAKKSSGKATVKKMAPAKTVNDKPLSSSRKATAKSAKATKATAKAPARKAGGGGATSAGSTAKSTGAKGGTGRAAEKAALDKTPAAKRARAIKATAKKSR